MYQHDQIHYGLGFTASGILQTYLFPGAIYNSHQMNIYAQIYDAENAYTIYNFTSSITVIPDENEDLNELEDRLISQDPTFEINIALNENSFKNQIVFEKVQYIIDLLNEQSLSDKFGLIVFYNSTGAKFPQIYGPLSNYNGVLMVITLIVCFYFIYLYLIQRWLIVLKRSFYDYNCD